MPKPVRLTTPTHKQKTTMQAQQIKQVVQKLQTLTPNRINEVEDFIDFLSQRDSTRQLTQAAMAASEPALNTVWDNTDDAEYDKL